MTMSNALHTLVTMKAINYHHLNYFRVIALAGGIAAASKVLRISQSSLSIQLRVFEDFFGHELFHRKNRRMTLTDFGKIILNYANDIYRLGAEMLEVANDGITLERPHVHLGAAHGVSKRQVLSLARQVLSTSECSLTISEDEHDALTRELMEHRIDLVLSNHPLRATGPSQLYSVIVDRCRMIFCGSRKFKIEKEELPYALHKKPVILPTIRQRLRHELDVYFKAWQINVKIVAETDDMAIQKSMAQAGMGIIAVPETDVKVFLNNGKLINYGYLDNIYNECWLHSAARRVENPIVNTLLKSVVHGTANSCG